MTMTPEEFDQIYEESQCDGDRDKIIAYLLDQRKQLLKDASIVKAQHQRELMSMVLHYRTDRDLGLDRALNQ